MQIIAGLAGYIKHWDGKHLNCIHTIGEFILGFYSPLVYFPTLPFPVLFIRLLDTLPIGKYSCFVAVWANIWNIAVLSFLPFVYCLVVLSPS